MLEVTLLGWPKNMSGKEEGCHALPGPCLHRKCVLTDQVVRPG